MNSKLAFFTIIIFSLLLSCEENNSEPDSITVNYKTGETLCFFGGFVHQTDGVNDLVYKHYIEQTLLSTDEHADTAFLRFELKTWELDTKIYYAIDTILVSKTKFYQLQHFTRNSYYGFFKSNNIETDTTKTPSINRAQMPMHPVTLTEGDHFKILRPAHNMENQVESEFTIKGFKKIGNFNGIFFEGKRVIDFLSEEDSPEKDEFRQLYSSNGKLISEYYFGQSSNKDGSGNIVSTTRFFHVLNRGSKQNNPGSFLSELKPYDLTRLY